MKPRSIISLIISAVLVLCGIVICMIASFKAEADGVMLFPKEDIEGNLVYSMNIDGVSKININVDDADIIIAGGAETSSIEVVNFNANYYKLTGSNGNLNFAQIDDFLSMFKFWDNGFSFKGMRYLLRFGDDIAGDKKIIINLANKEDIGIINLTTNKGDVSVENCSYAADYTIKAEVGTTEILNIKKAESINVYGNTTDVTMKSCDADKVVVNGTSINAVLYSITSEECSVLIPKGSLDMSSSTSDRLTVTSNEGDIKISDYASKEGTVTSETGSIAVNLRSTEAIAVHISNQVGKILVNGVYTDNYAIKNIAPTYKISISNVVGDINLTHP